MYIGWWFNPSEKYERTSVGMMKFPRSGKIKFMFQTTNQIYIYIQDGAPKTAKLPYKWFNYGL